MDAINAIESSMTAKRRETVNIEAVSSPFSNYACVFSIKEKFFLVEKRIVYLVQ